MAISEAGPSVHCTPTPLGDEPTSEATKDAAPADKMAKENAQANDRRFLVSANRTVMISVTAPKHTPTIPPARYTTGPDVGEAVGEGVGTGVLGAIRLKCERHRH